MFLGYGFADSGFEFKISARAIVRSLSMPLWLTVYTG